MSTTFFENEHISSYDEECIGNNEPKIIESWLTDKKSDLFRTTRKYRRIAHEACSSNIRKSFSSSPIVAFHNLGKDYAFLFLTEFFDRKMTNVTLVLSLN